MKPILSHLRPVLAAALPILAPATAHTAESVTLFIERATSFNGPWDRLDLRAVPLDVDGNPRLLLDKSREFYRTEIQWTSSNQLGDPIPLDEVPDAFVTRAMNFLAKRLEIEARGSAPDSEAWPAGARLGPHVFPMHSVEADGSVRPAYFEFKVLGPDAVPPAAGWLRNSPDDCLAGDAGYLLLSTTENDFPIAEFSTRGPTMCESLAMLAKTGRIRVVRFGPTFTAAEDGSGKLLSSKGAEPFKLDPDVLTLDGLEWKGDDATGLDQSPRKIPELTAEPYRSYEEFKLNFGANDTYIKLREIKKQRAKLEWDLALGRPIEGVTVRIGQSITVLRGIPAAPAPEYSFTSEEEEIMVTITLAVDGGIALTGRAPGDGVLRVRSGGQEFTLLVNVPAVARDIGEVIDSGYWYAGDWGAQPKYHQIQRDRWCPLVGCGPVAWAMLLAWFDRGWNVEASFRGEGSGDPPPDTNGSSNQGKVIPAYDELHEQCNVVCWGEFSDQGSTYPTDMTLGIKGYTYIPALANLIRRSWQINSTTGTWPDGAFRCRDAIKNGYPAVVGLGWMWHYALAYGYGYEKIEGPPGYVFTARYLKCNMGHGPDFAPCWYNLGDTFYAANFKITNP